MRYQRPKGTADILPEEAKKWTYVEETAECSLTIIVIRKSERRCLKVLTSFPEPLAIHQMS